MWIFKFVGGGAQEKNAPPPAVGFYLLGWP